MDNIRHCGAEETQGEPTGTLFRRHWFEAWGKHYLPQGRLKGPTKYLPSTPMANEYIPYVEIGPWGLRIVSLAGYYAPFRTLPSGLRASDGSTPSLAQLLAERRDVLMIRAAPTSEDDLSIEGMFQALSVIGWRRVTRQQACQYVVPLHDTVDAFRASLSRNLRTTLHRNRNRLMREGLFRVDRFTSLPPPDWRRVMAEIAQIESHSWLVDHEYGKTRFIGDQVQAFWSALLSDPVQSNLTTAWIAYVDNVPAAFTFCIDDFPCRYYIANQYDERYSRYGLSWLVNETMFVDSISRGFQIVNMGDGDKAYKARWGAIPGPRLMDRLAFRPGLRGSIARILFQKLMTP